MQTVFRWRTMGLAALALLTAATMAPEQAQAKKRYSSHGSSGSSGSSGGSYSSHGSSGSSGGKSKSHGFSGSSGGWYSSHGSSGSSSSSGSSGGHKRWKKWRRKSGSSSSHGSSGSSSGHYHSHGSSGSSGGRHTTPQPADHGAAPVAPPSPATTRRDVTRAMLVLNVPADANVFLAGQKMTLTGTERRFRIPVTDAAKEYAYPVKVELVRNGQQLVSNTVQKVRGGQTSQLAITESDVDGELVAVASR